MLCIGLIVEGVDLAVSGGAVQSDGLDESPVCLKPYSPSSVCGGMDLQFGQQAPTQPEATDGRCDPHPLELGWLMGVELQGATADRLRAQSGDQYEAAGESEVVGVGGDALPRVEADVEATVQFAEVFLQAVLRMRGAWDPTARP